MRVERKYWLQQAGTGDPDRADYHIHEREAAFCEDAECEALHDDPSKKYDWQSERIICIAHGKVAAKRILAALQGGAR
jgi:hypothetical protein